MLVKDELRKVQEDYDSLLIEIDISIRKAQAAFAASKDAEKQVEELTIELQRLKAVLIWLTPHARMPKNTRKTH